MQAEAPLNLFEQHKTKESCTSGVAHPPFRYLSPNRTMIETELDEPRFPVTFCGCESGSRKSMSNQARSNFLLKYQAAVCGALFILAGLVLLTGCQGVSANSVNPPGVLESNPATLTFGDVTVGHSLALSAVVSNTGASSVTISQVQISGSAFAESGIGAPLTLSPGTKATISVRFTPTAAGTANGTLTVTSNASDAALTIALSGAGTTTAGQLGVTPTTIPVGSVVVGTSGTASGNLNATGSSVTVTGASTNNTAFVVSGISLPLTIPAGQSAPFTITFSPSIAGSATATLTFTSDAQPTTTTAPLTGSGTPAPVHSVNLSWNASTSPNISGYNIYRAVYTTSCGSFSKINSLLNTGTLYTDSAVTDGTSYCYAATAVDTSNAESSYSNIASDVQIPPL